jgi:carbonic anhydrase/SulP family sulfate permease
VLLDARRTDYIDPDILDLIRDFREQTAPARGVKVSLSGFRRKYKLADHIQFVDYSSRELQSAISPEQVLQILKEGNERFRTGQRLSRDLSRQVVATASAQHPLAVVLSCIDSRTPAELILDLGVGDVFSIRVAGNIICREVLASMEYGCAVAGAKLVVILGHTRCGAVTTAVELASSTGDFGQITGCQHIEHLVREIHESLDLEACRRYSQLSTSDRDSLVNKMARANVLRTVQQVVQQSQTLGDLGRAGRVSIVGAIYDVATGIIEFLPDAEAGRRLDSAPSGLVV